MGRYAVFIDGGYARKVLNQYGNPKISYVKFSDYVASSEERLRTYYYDCAPYVSSPPTQQEREKQSAFHRFIAALEAESRFQVRLGRLSRRRLPNGTFEFEQKMVDILLAIDLVRLSVEHQISRAVILAKDSDFVPAIETARNAGTVVQLYYHVPPKPNDDLLRACDERILIDAKLVDNIKL